MEDRIRTRAYLKWLARPNKNSPSELDDWLAAEIEELALDLADAVSEMTFPEPSFTQDDLWFGSDQIAKMFALLTPRLRKRRVGSHLLSLIEDYQDYLTSSAPVGDEEASRLGVTALHILRLLASLKVLIGNDLALTATHSFRKELKDIFAEDRIAFDTSEFNVYSAATIQRQARLPVSFIKEGDETMPDLQVGDIAYVECKDIHTDNRNNFEKTLTDNLAKAHAQLATAQQRCQLVGTGVCIDVPWGAPAYASGVERDTASPVRYRCATIRARLVLRSDPNEGSGRLPCGCLSGVVRIGTAFLRIVAAETDAAFVLYAA
jgi:Protein of unknown function (DUF2934)